MFSGWKQLVRKTGRDGEGRMRYLQQLVCEFQSIQEHIENNQIPASHVHWQRRKELVAHLANFCYDPIHFDFIRKLNVIGLFLDVLEESEISVVESASAGLSNLCNDDQNLDVFLEDDGIERCVTTLLRCHENETICLNILSILYFISYQSDLAKTLLKHQNLLKFLSNFEYCPSCSTQVVAPHMPLVHFSLLLRSNVQRLATADPSGVINHDCGIDSS